MSGYRVFPDPTLLDEFDPCDGAPAHYIVAAHGGTVLGYVTRGTADPAGRVPWLVSAVGHGPGPDARDLAAGAAWVAAHARPDGQDEEAAPPAVARPGPLAFGAVQFAAPGEVHVSTVGSAVVLHLGPVAVAFDPVNSDGDPRDLVDVARRIRAAAAVVQAEVSQRIPAQPPDQ